MSGVQRNDPRVILEFRIGGPEPRGAQCVDARLVPAAHRSEHPRHRIVGVDFVAAFAQIGSRRREGVGQMLVMFGVVHRQQAIVDALNVEETLLGADQRVGSCERRPRRQRALRVGLIAERLRQRIEFGAARRGGQRAVPVAVRAIKFGLIKQRHRVIGEDAQRLRELGVGRLRVAGLKGELRVTHVIPRARVGGDVEDAVDDLRRLRHLVRGAPARSPVSSS